MNKSLFAAAFAAFRHLLVAGLGLGVVFAQQAGTSPDKKKDDSEIQKLEKFEVTGSLIKRIDMEGPAPVQIITRAVMDRSGASTVQDVLLKIPSNFAGAQENLNNQGATGGQGNVSLRGLGVETTLLLVNGRRVAPSAVAGGASFVNINSLPLAAIERIEVLQDGASAIYGSDAIAGVVNVILRKDYTGFENSFRYGNTTKTDVSERNYSFVTGASTGKSSTMIVFDYLQRNSLLRNERRFMDTADQRQRNADGTDFRSPTGNPGTVYLRPGSAYFTATNPLGLPANASGIFGIPDGSTGVWDNNSVASRTAFASKLLAGTERTFDFASPNQITPATKRIGLYGTSSYDMTPNISAFLEVSYDRTESDVALAAVPVTASGAVSVIPANSPFNPFGEPINFRFRTLDAGPRVDTITTDTYRLLAGLKGKIFETWSWEAGVMFNSDKVVDIGSNYVVTSDVIAAASGTFAKAPGVFLNVFGDKQGNPPALIKALSNNTTQNAELTQQTVDGKISGELFDIPAGPVGMAFGAEGRRERLTVILDPLTQTGAFAGSGTRDNTFGSRQVASAYAELSVPLFSAKQNIPFVQSAELQIAGRKENYYIRGKTYAKFDSTKPKYALSWKPVKDLLIRASYSEGFRAPSLFELFSGANGSFPTVNDPLRNKTDLVLTSPTLLQALKYWVPSAPTTGSVTLAGTGLAADDAQQVNQAQSGYTDLKPEEAKSRYLGFVYQVPVVKGLLFSGGYYKIKHTNIIRLTTTTQLLTDPALQVLVRREPQSPEDAAAGRPGRLKLQDVALFVSYFNRALVEVSGVDFNIEYSTKTDTLGKFKFNLAGNYMAHFWDQTTITSAITDNVGTGFTSQGTVPRVKGNFRTDWDYKDFGVTAWVNYSGHYNDFSTPRNVYREVEAFVTLDLQFNYSMRTPFIGTGTTKFTAGLINATDVSPPFVTENITGSGNTGFDFQIADPRGRRFYVQLTQSF